MAEKILSYALTSLPRVKDRFVIEGDGHDIVLTRLINGVTDFIESQCGGRRFLETTYTNEVYTIYNANQKYIPLKNSPVGTVTAVQYRSGLKSNPNWTSFNVDDWELSEDGTSGLVRVHGILRGINLMRVSYVAGYKIDWGSAGDVSAATHTLPADLSDLAERLVNKAFTRRNKEGIASEAFNGGSVSYKDFLDTYDQETISRYTRLPMFV